MMQRSPSEQVGHLKKIKVKNQSEVLTPKQKNKRLREEVDILKKAVVYFAKELKWSMPLFASNAPIIY